jgi:hypothetical protein
MKERLNTFPHRNFLYLFIARHSECEQYSFASEMTVEVPDEKVQLFYMTSVAGVGRPTRHEGRERIPRNEGRARKFRLRG